MSADRCGDTVYGGEQVIPGGVFEFHVLTKKRDFGPDVSTELGTRKAGDIAHDGRVAVAIPVPRIPFAPPSLIHFQTTAGLLPLDDPHIRRLVEAGDLNKITKHDELDLADGCFLRIAIPSRVNTYGLGMSIYRFARDPLNAGGVTHLPER